MLDELTGGLLGHALGQGLGEKLWRGRARRKAQRFSAGERIVFQALLGRFEPDAVPQPGRLHLTPGTDRAQWTPGPWWKNQPSLELVLLGGKGEQVWVDRGWWSGQFPAYAWLVRIDDSELASILVQKMYMRAFAPALSLGVTPTLQSRRRR